MLWYQQNAERMEEYMKKIISLFLVILLIFCAAACQATPEDAVVTSKNDGAFESALYHAEEQAVEEANEPQNEESTETSSIDTSKTYVTEFSSTDGSILYSVDLVEPFVPETMDVLRVTPHDITSEDAQRIAKAIFGDEEVYEYSTEMSRAELEERILELRQHISSWDSLLEYYGGDESIASMVQENYEARIATLEDLYEDASDCVTAKLCDWEFHSPDYYLDPSYGISYGDDPMRELKATIWVDGTPYVYTVSNREGEDYRLHSVSAYIDDLMVPESQKYSTDAITQKDRIELAHKAQEILDSMGMGEWVIDSVTTSYKPGDDADGYSILRVTACPVYNDVKVTYQGQISNLKSDDAYASDYYYENIEFTFSGGRLTSFFYDATLDVVDTNENVPILSFAEAMKKFQSQMEIQDASYYIGTASAEIDVTRVELGLARIRIQNNETDFYLTPAYTFYGISTLYDEASNEINWGFGQDDAVERLLTINAVDGSVINVDKGY